MLEAVKYMMIRDICVRDLYFYEEEKTEDLVQFCKEKSISYIPSKDRKSCWKLKGSKFEHIPKLPKSLVCNPESLIFAESTLQKFEQENHDEVMFVVEKGIIKGIVHIVDYNNTNLFVELYRLLLKFENNVRNLLLQRKLGNQDFLGWIKQKGEKNYFYRDLYKKSQKENEVEKRKNANTFQTFYLKDLLLFARSLELLHFSNSDLDDISEIRNWVAHSKDVTAIKINSEHSVYNIKGLKKFIKITKSFFMIYDDLEITLDQLKPQKAHLQI